MTEDRLGHPAVFATALTKGDWHRKRDGNDGARSSIVWLDETPDRFFTILGNSTDFGAPYRDGAIRGANLRR